LYQESIGLAHFDVTLAVTPVIASGHLDLTFPTVRNADSDVKNVIVAGRPALPREDQVAQRVRPVNPYGEAILVPALCVVG
jgi:hypothetical protein